MGSTGESLFLTFFRLSAFTSFRRRGSPLIDLIPAETSFPVQFHRNFRVRLINPDNIQFYPAIISIPGDARIRGGNPNLPFLSTSHSSSTFPANHHRAARPWSSRTHRGKAIHRLLAATFTTQRPPPAPTSLSSSSSGWSTDHTLLLLIWAAKRGGGGGEEE